MLPSAERREDLCREFLERVGIERSGGIEIEVRDADLLPATNQVSQLAHTADEVALARLILGRRYPSISLNAGFAVMCDT